MRIAAFMEHMDQIVRESGASLETVLRRYKEEGLESLYMNYTNLKAAGEEELFSLLTSIGYVVEGLWENISFNTMSDAEAEAAYKEVVDCAKRLGAKHLLITPGFFHSGESGKKATREEVVERDAEIVKMIEAVRRAKAYGDSQGVYVTLEDYDWFSSPIAYPEVLRRFFEEIPDLKCTFDTGNFIPCDVDVMEEFAYYKEKIVALHLKDRVLEDDQNGIEREPYITFSGKKYYPASVGSGDMHVKEILTEMKAIGYDGCGIIELFNCNDLEAKMSASIKWLKENR